MNVFQYDEDFAMYNPCWLLPAVPHSERLLLSKNFINFHSIKFYVLYNPYKNPYNAAYHYTDICFLQEVRV